MTFDDSQPNDNECEKWGDLTPQLALEGNGFCFKTALLRSWMSSQVPTPRSQSLQRSCRAERLERPKEPMWGTQNSPKESGITSEPRELEGGCLDYGYNPKVFIAVAVINCRGLAHVALQRPERKRWLELRGFLPSGDLNLWFRGWCVLGVPLEELCVLKSRNNSIR